MSARIYQPTPEELLALWPALDPADKTGIAAKAMLADVNLAFSRFTERMRVYDPLTRRVAILTAGQPPQCTCLQWRERPLTLPRDRRHCPHTLAWEGYVTILRGHYERQAQALGQQESVRRLHAGSSFRDLMAFAQALHRSPPAARATPQPAPATPAWIAAAQHPVRRSS